MADADRRALDRADKTDEDLAAVIRERLRTGELELRRVKVAAWLGYGPAALAADPEPPARRVRGRDAAERVKSVIRNSSGLFDSSHGDLKLAALAVEFAERASQHESAARLLAALRNWLARPESETEEWRVAQETEAAERAEEELPILPPPGKDEDLRADVIAASLAFAAANSALESVQLALRGDSLVGILVARTAFRSRIAAEPHDPEAEAEFQARRLAEVICWGSEALQPAPDAA
jgi:hypothetical protein